MSVILPGGTLGILGGGQLGRMTAMAARSLGYHLAALDPDVDLWRSRFEGIVRDEHARQDERTRAAVALARHGSEQLDFLTERLLEAPVRDHFFLRDELRRSGIRLLPRLWQVLSNPAESGRKRLAAASALASYDSSSDRWDRVAPAVVRLLINLDPLFYGTFAEIGAGQEVAR